MCAWLKKSIYVYYFLKFFLFLTPFWWISLALRAHPAGFKLASPCYYCSILLMNYILKICFVQTYFYWIHQIHAENYFCYKSIFPVSLWGEPGMPARSSARSASLPPLISRVSTGKRPKAAAPCCPGGPAIHGKVRKLHSLSSAQGREIKHSTGSGCSQEPWDIGPTGPARAGAPRAGDQGGLLELTSLRRWTQYLL